MNIIDKALKIDSVNLGTIATDPLRAILRMLSLLLDKCLESNSNNLACNELPKNLNLMASDSTPTHTMTIQVRPAAPPDPAGTGSALSVARCR